jgi:glycosyltransferase involved in cell wall biosynthesis
VVHVLAPARQGGLERVVEMLASGQGSRAQVAVVLTPSDAEGHPFVHDLHERGVRVCEIVVPGRAYLREYRALRALIATVRPDILHTHGYRADIIGSLAARRAGIPVVSTAHGFVGGSFRNRLNERLQCLALRYAFAVIAVSRPLVKRLEAAGVHADRIRVVPNAYASPVPVVASAAARATLGLDPGALIAGWVGRLSGEKGPDVMLAALSAGDRDWRLSIVGEGHDRVQLGQQAEVLGVTDRVVWHGAVARAGSLMSAFDAFVLSSRTEGTPIALFEAMAARVPIIATRVGGVPDVVTDAEAILVPSESPEAIAEALAAIRSDPAAARRRCEAALERLTTVFGAGEWVRSIERIYDQAART